MSTDDHDGGGGGHGDASKVTSSAGFGFGFLGPPTDEELADMPDLTPAPAAKAATGPAGVESSPAVGAPDVGAPTAEPVMVPGVTVNQHHPRFLGRRRVPAGAGAGAGVGAGAEAPPSGGAAASRCGAVKHRFAAGASSVLPPSSAATPAPGARAAPPAPPAATPAAADDAPPTTTTSSGTARPTDSAAGGGRVTSWMDSVNPYGPFRMYETVREQLGRVGRLRDEVPVFAAALLKQGRVLVQHAEAGKLDRIQFLVDGAEEGELLFYYTAQMFNAAAAGGHVDVIRYMVLQGLDRRLRGIANALHLAVEKCPDGAVEDVVSTLLQFGFAVNGSRTGDYYTPLHVACELGRGPVGAMLVKRGADVNAVAADDRMPLPLAEASVPDSELIAILRAYGARVTWRQDKPRVASGGGVGTATTMISLAHIKKPSAPASGPTPPRRIAWGGGAMMSNKSEALQRFLAKRGGEGALTDTQRRLLALSKTSHERTKVAVKDMPSMDLHKAARRADAATTPTSPAEPEPALLGLPPGFGGVRHAGTASGAGAGAGATPPPASTAVPKQQPVVSGNKRRRGGNGGGGAKKRQQQQQQRRGNGRKAAPVVVTKQSRGGGGGGGGAAAAAAAGSGSGSGNGNGGGGRSRKGGPTGGAKAAMSTADKLSVPLEALVGKGK